MSASAVRTALRAALEAAITAGSVSAPYVDTINRKVRNEDRVAEWITIQFFGDTEEQISLGEAGRRLFRETGTVEFEVITKAGTGDGRGTDIAEEIRDLFRAANLASGITVEEVRPPDTGDGNDNGKTFSTIVEIVYRREIEA